MIHLTSGDSAGDLLKEAGLDGEVLVWRDILYDGPRPPGWPDADALKTRAVFLAGEDPKGPGVASTHAMLQAQYQALKEGADASWVLWFDACLFDQSMLAHVLTCLHVVGAEEVELLCVSAFPGIEPFHGLGQLTPEQLVSLYPNRTPVTPEQVSFAEDVDRAFATQNTDAFSTLASMETAPLPWVPAAVRRWLQEQPDPETGLGRLESLILQAVGEGARTPGEVFRAVAAMDTPPQYWGDSTLWQKVNDLADRAEAPIRIEGPTSTLPVWPGAHDLADYAILPGLSRQ